MDQSPKAKFLRAKHIARERERLWYWRVFVGLQKCCLPKKGNQSNKDEDREECMSVETHSISIPRLVEVKRRVERVMDVRQTEAIDQFLKIECEEASREIGKIYHKHAEKRMLELKQEEIIKHMKMEQMKVRETEAINQFLKMECDEATKEMIKIYHEHAEKRMAELKREELIKNMVEIEQKETVKHDEKPWARRRHYYNEYQYDRTFSDNFGDEESLPNYKPWSISHLDQGCRPWARRRHYYNQAQYVETFLNSLEEEEIHPVNTSSVARDNDSNQWRRRRHYFNESRSAIKDPNFEEEEEEKFRPWARRRHYYNETR